MARPLPEPVFTEATTEARRTGRCMGCDAMLDIKPSRRRRVICGDPLCRRYYNALYRLENYEPIPGKQRYRRLTPAWGK